jgi:hypothetical protein
MYQCDSNPNEVILRLEMCVILFTQVREKKVKVNKLR